MHVIQRRCCAKKVLEHLEETDEGESWSIHSLWILAIHPGDVAALWPFIFQIARSAPSDRHLGTAHVVRTVQ
jgi:hypothetical protein